MWGICLTQHTELMADVLINRCSDKFCNIHRKNISVGAYFNKVTGLETPTYAYHGVKNVSFSEKFIYLGFSK